MNCSSCGSPLKPDAKFCGSCGARAVAAGDSAPPPPPTPPTPPAPPAPSAVSAPPTPASPAPASPIPVASGGIVDSDGFITGPPPSSRAAASRPAPEMIDSRVEELDPEATTAAPPRSRARWTLVLPDGSNVPIAGTVVAGRDPSTKGHDSATTVVLIGASKSVSKSHALIEVLPTSLSLRDLGSTNGLLVVRADGTELEVDGDTVALLANGDEVEFGDYVVGVVKAKS